jgi:outer membrane protein insertion porin family
MRLPFFECCLLVGQTRNQYSREALSSSSPRGRAPTPGEALRRMTTILGVLGGMAFSGSGAWGEVKSLDVHKVTVSGARRIAEAAIVSQLKHTKGAVSPDELSEDVKTLYRTGFFDRVSVRVEGGDAHATVVYEVTEKPVIRKIFVTGNKEIKESDLSGVFSLGTRRFLDRARLDGMARAAVQYYQNKGFYDATVDYAVTSISPDQSDVTFTVSEGSRFRIQEIRFRGLKELDGDDLRSKIETKRYKWWNSWLLGTGRLNQEQLQTDKSIVTQQLLDHGLIDGTVSDPAIERVDDHLVVTFDVNEGGQYRVGPISASGDLVNGSLSETLSGISLSTGDVFNASEARKDAFDISDKFSDVGFAFVNVVPRTNVNRNDKTVGIDYSIAKGEEVSVRRVTIKGNSKTYDNVIRRDVKIPEGGIYSSSKLRRTETLLRRLGYFEEVTIGTDPVPGRSDQVDLTLNVREASTGAFSAGAGFSTTDGAIFNSNISENNLFGTGRQVALNVDVGSLRNNAVLSFTDPRLNDSLLSAGVDLQHATRELIDFSRAATGVGTTWGYPLEPLLGSWAQDINGSLRYDFMSVEILNVQEANASPIVIESEGKSTISAFTPQIIRNTIDNPLNPTKGVRQLFGVEFAGLGGEQEYYLVTAANSWYRPLFALSNGPVIFSMRTRLDYGESLTDDRFPLFKRFFPGGITSVRGYRNRTLGPRDDQGRQYGGSKELINNVELIVPLIQAAGINGVVFYDVGEAFDDDASIELSALRRAYGGGIRWASPMGPIRIEFGFPGDRRPGERGMVTLFSFGAPL